jgi:hypothetical protein
VRLQPKFTAELSHFGLENWWKSLSDVVAVSKQYGTDHSYVLIVHRLRVAENEILKLDLPAKRH